MPTLLFDADALAHWLLSRALLDVDALARARRVSAESGGRIDRVLTQLGLVPERTMAEALGALLGIAVAGAADYPTEPLFADRLSPRFLREKQVLPLGETADGVLLAMADPLDPFVRSGVELAVGRPVIPLVAIPAELEAALQALHREAEGDKAPDGVTSIDAEAPDDVERLRNIASEAPVIRLVNQLIARAVDQRASDIHIEPFEARLRVRYRIDGVLQEQESPPKRLASAIASRIKIMARLDIAERRLPQDGRLKLVVRGKEIDFRVATVPTLHGEAVVLRILDWSSVRLDFEALGFEGEPLHRFLAQLDRPNGIVLVTGPTGSGKTTTLYAALSRLNKAERKILTVEDPVEYQLEGINQIQVKPDIGLDFAQVLRSFLRHDPDVMMVGEIRDLETAQVATQAALTGHLVLSTLHTNGAAASVSRLLDIGLADYLVVSSLAAVVAQRLVRVLCPHCREPYTAPPELAARLGLPAGSTLHRPRGCPACQNSGYTGRTGVYEVLVMDDAIRSAVLSRTDAAALHRAAVAAGMRTLFEDGARKVAQGITTPEEIWRVTQDA